MIILLCFLFSLIQAQQMPNYFRQISTEVLGFPETLSEDGLRHEWGSITSENYLPEDLNGFLREYAEIQKYAMTSKYINGIRAKHYYDEYQAVVSIVNFFNEKDSSLCGKVIYAALRTYLIASRGVLLDLYNEDPQIPFYLKEQGMGIYTAVQLKKALIEKKVSKQDIFQIKNQPVHVEELLQTLC